MGSVKMNCLTKTRNEGEEEESSFRESIDIIVNVKMRRRFVLQINFNGFAISVWGLWTVGKFSKWEGS